LTINSFGVRLNLEMNLFIINETDFITPREVLQAFGTVGRNCYKDIWVEYAIRTYNKLQLQNYSYDIKKGIIKDNCENCYPRTTNVVISDCRFQNEFAALKSAGAFMIRLIRPGSGLSGKTANHESETEQASIPDDSFDAILYNSGTLEELKEKVENIVNYLQD
jgi:hypothetical protein